MITVRLVDGVLCLDGTGDDQIFGWDHRLFLTITAGYRLDEAQACYLLSEETEVTAILEETIEYLRDEEIDFEVDEGVARLLQRLQHEQQDYEHAVAAGPMAQCSEEGIPPPPTLVRQLKRHQVRSFRHLLAVKHGANFSVPGSGKTTVVYAAFEALRRQGTLAKLLVVGPRSCFLPWEEEFMACFGFPPRSARLTGSKESRCGLYLDADRHDLFLCTYQTASNDVDELVGLCKRHAVFVVIDESHNIKRLQGGVWSEAALQIGRYAARRAILSGTPMPNTYADLWTQFTFLWPRKEVLGDRAQYRHTCEDPTQHARLREAIRPFFVRVRKSELDLPPVRLQRIHCELKPYQESIYQALSVRFIGEINARLEDRKMLRQWRKARMVRLIQAASNPALLAKYSEEFDVPPLGAKGASITELIDRYPRYEVPAKFERAVELVRDLVARDEKVILWTSFVHNIRMMQTVLADLQPFVVYGAVPRDATEDIEFNREQQLRLFKRAERAGVLLANPAACAESVSLHSACQHAIYLDRTFNCGQYMQSLDRIHRIGLGPDDMVTYHILVAADTIDETIDRRLEEKQATMIRLLEDELPLGTLQVEEKQMGQSESEEAVDFEQTMKDIERQLQFTAQRNPPQ